MIVISVHSRPPVRPPSFAVHQLRRNASLPVYFYCVALQLVLDRRRTAASGPGFAGYLLHLCVCVGLGRGKLPYREVVLQQGSGICHGWPECESSWQRA